MNTITGIKVLQFEAFNGIILWPSTFDDRPNDIDT